MGYLEGCLMAALNVTILAATDAQPGDVVLDGSGTEWKRGPGRFNWSTFTGPVVYEGSWEDSYGPQGDLILLVRDGRPQVAVVP